MVKRLALLLSIILLFNILLTSCVLPNAGNGGTDDSGNVDDSGAGGVDGDSEASECVRYTADERVSIISSWDADRESIFAVSDAFKKCLGTDPLMKSDSYDKTTPEIMLGKTNRITSQKAYSIMERMYREDSFDYRYLIYADEEGVAIAFDNNTEWDTVLTALRPAVQYLIDSYFTTDGKVEIPYGIIHTGSIDLLETQRELDVTTREAAWQKLANAVAKLERGDEIYTAMESLYTLYDPAIAVWIANLYEPFNCYCGKCKPGTLACYGGGFYYSNSARDNDGYYPDAESTLQALNLITGSGILRTGYAAGLPGWMGEQMVQFIRELQDENGFFYHPQWTKAATDSRVSRRARDLSWCTSILTGFGALPKYDTPTGVKGEESYNSSAFGITAPLSASRVTAVSKVILTASYAKHLENNETFTNYLASNLPSNAKPGGGAPNGFYGIGNTLTSQMSQIITRDKQLQKDGATYSLVDILIDWLNTYQNPKTGHWSNEENYAGTNGLLKISGIYTAAGVEIPNAEAAARSAINAITSDEYVGAVVDIYNTWFAANQIIGNISKCGKSTEIDGVTVTAQDRIKRIRESIYEIAPEAIAATQVKIGYFKKADGSFSYLRNQSSSTSQGMPVAVPGTNEGDVNATIICTTGILSNMVSCLGLSYPKFCYESDRLIFMNILETNYKASQEKK